MSVSLNSLCRWQVQVHVYCAWRISGHVRCTQCSILLHLMDGYLLPNVYLFMADIANPDLCLSDLDLSRNHPLL